MMTTNIVEDTVKKPVAETMVSFLVPTPILETIDDLRETKRGKQSRSAFLRELVNDGLKNH
jgi:hypothetical protein